jgi:hypothetical protein
MGDITRCAVIPLATEAGEHTVYRVAIHDVLTYPTFRTMEDARRYADALRDGRLEPAFFSPTESDRSPGAGTTMADRQSLQPSRFQ